MTSPILILAQNGWLLKYLTPLSLLRFSKVNRVTHSYLTLQAALYSVALCQETSNISRESVEILLKLAMAGICYTPSPSRVLCLGIFPGRCELCSGITRGIRLPWGVQCCKKCLKDNLSQLVSEKESKYKLFLAHSLFGKYSDEIWRKNIFSGNSVLGPVLTLQTFRQEEAKLNKLVPLTEETSCLWINEMDIILSERAKKHFHYKHNLSNLSATYQCHSLIGKRRYEAKYLQSHETLSKKRKQKEMLKEVLSSSSL